MKKISNINSENRNKVINKNKTFIKKKSIINYRNKFNKLHLFKEKISLTRNNALDIKSYKTTFVTPTTSEKQEMKLSHLCSSLLNLSQNDELLNNSLNNYEEKLESSKEIKIGKIKEKINEIINKSKGYINIKEKEFKKIEKNIFNEREINEINLISTKKLFKSKSSLMNNKDIIFLFELFFISLYEWSYKNIDKINPNHFQIINKDIAIFAYIIKNLLDYFGINKENFNFI